MSLDWSPVARLEAVALNVHRVVAGYYSSDILHGPGDVGKGSAKVYKKPILFSVMYTKWHCTNNTARGN